MNRPSSKGVPRNWQTTLSPGIRPGQDPPFHEMGEYVFQELCRDLLAAEPEIATCEIYGERGQRQDGIDLLAHVEGGHAIEVAQCKCYADFSAAEIRKASDEFLEHWEHWSGEKVKRFILFVASGLTARQCQDAVIEQKKRFVQSGIEYEAWSAPQIRNKLRQHPDIVSTYLHPAKHWVQTICGVESQTSPQPGTVPVTGILLVLTALGTTLERLTTRLSGVIDQRIENMRTAWQEGRRRDVVDQLRTIKGDDALWPALSPEVRAKLLRLESSVELYMSRDVGRAEELASEARTLAPSDQDIRLQAQIEYIRTGPDAAITLLTEEDEPDSVSLKALLLLETGRAEESRAVLDAVTRVRPDAEAHRIRALSYLVTKDLSQAQLEIQKALELEPRWQSIRFTAAAIDYFGALSPAALPNCLVAWPEPIDWALVKRDSESLSRLRRAADIFQELAEGTDTAQDERWVLEGWRLACLADDPDQQEKAVQYCRRVLRSDPTHLSAIIWAAALSLHVSLKPSRTALMELLRKGAATVPDIVALVVCLLASVSGKKAIKVLEDTRHVFLENDAAALWTLWYVQAQAISGDPNAALGAIESSGLETELRHARSLALRVLSKKTGGWEQLLQHLESSYLETGDARFLLESCQLMAQQEKWEYVADKVDLLIKEIGTSEAVRLASLAACNSRRFDVCLHLLDGYRSFFGDSGLPSELRRMRVFCQQSLGILPEAIAEAEALVRDDPTAKNLLTLAHLCYTVGDLKRLSLVARTLADRPDLPPNAALMIARLVQWEDQALSRALWRKATSGGVPDSLVGEAITLGYQLMPDEKLEPLLARMASLGREGIGGIQVASIETVASLVLRQREHLQEVDELYRSGMAPVHMVADQARQPLVDLYHSRLQDNASAPDPKRQRPLLARHGGRALKPGLPQATPKWRLNLDVTAVLLAAHLGILATAAQAFRPLRIPADLMPALLRMLDRTTFPQPSRVGAWQQIIELVEKASLQVVPCKLPSDYSNAKLVAELGEDWVAVFEQARAGPSRVVEFMPLVKRDLTGPPSALPEDGDQFLTSCAGVLEALRQGGPLSTEEYEKALGALGNQGRSAPRGAIPEQGSMLYCHASILELFATADLLHIACERFQVRIEQREFDRVTAELRACERMDASRKWLENLMDGLSKGIRDGHFEVIPRVSEEKGSLRGAAIENPDLSCLLTLLQFEAGEADVIWADDRYVNGFVRRDRVPIIGISEVLKSLVGAGTLEVNGYYSKLTRLRAADVRFIPVEPDEILHHLRQARVQEGILVETTDLKVLRQYVAACLMQGNVLQKPPMPEGAPNPHGEIGFALGLRRAITDALTRVWADREVDPDICFARAEWLIGNLYLDYLGLVSMSMLPRSELGDRYLVALDMAALVFQAFSLHGHGTDDGASERRRYLDWLVTRVLLGRFHADPHLAEATANALRDHLLLAQREVAKEAPAPAVIRLLQRFYQDLPKPIHDALERDADFMQAIGFRSVLTINDLHFDPNSFWLAAAEAMNGRPAHVVPIASDREIRFERSDEGHALSFVHPITDRRVSFEPAGLGLLLDSPSEREVALRRYRPWFDCPEKAFAQAVAEIVSLDSPRRRMEQLESWRRASAAVYYEDLSRQLRQQGHFDFRDLTPPNADGLLRHFRLSPDLSQDRRFSDILDAAAETLIREENLYSAIHRLVAFPVPLPAVLVEAVAKLPWAQRRTLIKQLLQTAGSPLSTFHLIRLLVSAEDDRGVIRRLAQRVAARLFAPEAVEEFETFLAILKWVNDESGYWPEAGAWAPGTRLAVVWAHAHRLHSILISAGAPCTWLRERFGSGQPWIPRELFERDPDRWFDVSHPRAVTRETLLLYGLHYCLGDSAGGFLAGGLRDLLRAVLLLEKDGRRLPAAPLMRDLTGARNSLQSFLLDHRDQCLSAFLGAADAHELAQFLGQLAEQAVATLAQNSRQFSAWVLLSAVLGDLPPPDGLVDPLRTLFQQVDFAGLYRASPDLGCLAIHIASLQAAHLGEHLRCYLKGQLTSIAELLAVRGSEDTSRGSLPRDDSDASGDSRLIVLDSALNICLAAPKPEDPVAEFADLLMQLLKVFPSMTHVCKPLVERLYLELPIAQARQFLPMLVGLRAE